MRDEEWEMRMRDESLIVLSKELKNSQTKKLKTTKKLINS